MYVKSPQSKSFQIRKKETKQIQIGKGRPPQYRSQILPHENFRRSSLVRSTGGEEARRGVGGAEAPGQRLRGATPELASIAFGLRSSRLGADSSGAWEGGGAV
jgi:hypothetical protein